MDYYFGVVSKWNFTGDH